MGQPIGLAMTAPDRLYKEGRPRVAVLGTLPPPYSGYETATELLMKAGLDDEFEMILVDTQTAADTSSRGRVSVANIVSVLRVWGRCVRGLQKHRPAVVCLPLGTNTTGFLKWLLLAVTAKASGSRLLSRLGGSAANHLYRRSSRPMRAAIRFGLGLIDTLVVLGPSLVSQFEGMTSLSKIVVIPNGFDIDGWRRNLPSRLPSDKTRVLFLGQVSKAKGVFDLLHAVCDLGQMGEAAGFDITIAGPIVERERNILHIHSPKSTSATLDSLRRSHPAVAAVTFTGPVSWDEKRRLLAATDILVLPSYSEGFPYVVLEAMASGCAVITTPVGAVPDFLHDGHEVLLVPPGDPAAIRTALLRLRDPEARQALVESANIYLQRVHALEVFRNNMATQFRKLLPDTRLITP